MAAQPEAPERQATASPLDRHAPPVADRTAAGAVKDGRATASMILGILAIPLMILFWPIGLVLAVVGIVLGVISRNNIRRNGLAGGGQATAGIACSVVALVLFVAVLAVGIAVFSSKH